MDSTGAPTSVVSEIPHGVLASMWKQRQEASIELLLNSRDRASGHKEGSHVEEMVMILEHESQT